MEDLLADTPRVLCSSAKDVRCALGTTRGVSDCGLGSRRHGEHGVAILVGECGDRSGERIVDLGDRHDVAVVVTVVELCVVDLIRIEKRHGSSFLVVCARDFL